MTMQAQRVGFVTVTCGIYAESYPVAGLTVGEVRRRLKDHMKIMTKAVAVVDGKLVNEERLLVGGEVLTFVRLAGEIGQSD